MADRLLSPVTRPLPSLADAIAEVRAAHAALKLAERDWFEMQHRPSFAAVRDAHHAAAERAAISTHTLRAVVVENPDA